MKSVCSGPMLLCLLALTAGSAAAQTAAPKDAKDSKDAKSSKEAQADAEAAAAMERARRLASNPMRIILEASRVRRRGDAEAPPAQLVPVAATGTGGAAVAAVPAGEVAARSVPATPREAAPVAAAAVPEAVISSDLAQQRSAAAPAAALELAPVAQTVVPAAVKLAPLAALQPELAKPTLVSRVDPDPPHRLLADMPANTVVTADLTIQADGSVSQVTLVSTNATARSLGRYVVAALQQWRFAPLPGERVWRVDLLFRADE